LLRFEDLKSNSTIGDLAGAIIKTSEKKRNANRNCASCGNSNEKVAALTAAVLSIRRSKTYNQRRLLAILREVLAPAQIFRHSGRA
jgi:hypothetical protein